MNAHLCGLGGVLLSLLLMCFRAHAQLTSFQPIDLPVGVSEMRAMGISSDASTVVGVMTMTDPVSAQVVRRPFKWTQTAGVQVLEVPSTPPGYSGPPIEGSALACSGDGSVVVGWSTPDADSVLRRASKWSAGSRTLLAQQWSYGEAVDVSDDGRVIVGNTSNLVGGVPPPPSNTTGVHPGFALPEADRPVMHAYCTDDRGETYYACASAIAWDFGNLEIPPLWSFSYQFIEVRGVSRNGDWLVGASIRDVSTRWPPPLDGGIVRWPVGASVGQPQVLWPSYGSASCVSDAGQAFGWIESFGLCCEWALPYGEPSRFIAANQKLQLPAPRPLSGGTVTDCSRDGKVVVGSVSFLSGDGGAMRWEIGLHAQPIKETLIAREVPGVAEWTLSVATGVSADGSVICGFGSLANQPGVRAWIATLPTSCIADVDDGSGTGTRDGGVTIDDLLYFLSRFEAGC